MNVFTEKPGWITHRLAMELVDNKETHGKICYGFKTDLEFLRRKLMPSIKDLGDIDYFLPYFLIKESKNRKTLKVSCLTHYEPENKQKRVGWDLALEKSNAFVAISQTTYKEALKQGVDRNKIRLIKYGVDQKYSPSFNILIVGSAGRRKGMDFLTSLMEILRFEENIDWRSASEKNWNLKTISDDAIVLTLAYSWADILVVPSELEGAHTGTLEALFSGVRVLTRPVGWAKYELNDFVESYGNPETMAKRIKELKDSKCKPLIKKNSKLINAGFSYDSWRTDHYNFFKGLTL